MTIFRGELGGWFLVMFISLLVGKVWGWIGEGRVEYLEQQPPANPRLFHIRLALSLVLTVLFDSFMLRYCVHTVISQARPDMMVMFGFEFAILTILSTSTLLRYAIALTEISITRQQVKAKMDERRAEIRAARVQAIQEHARAGAPSPPTDLPDENDVDEMEIDVPGWEEKGRWVFYLDLLTDLLKLVVYLSFFGILLTFYGLPIHILRDVVVTIRSFARRIMDFLRYRNATRDMNERYPDAPAEEVSREDVCIICREEMHPVQPAAGAAEPGQPAATARRVPDRLRPKKLPCGHILHFACLRSWLERQQNCPTCRRPVLMPTRTQGAAATNAGAPQNGQPGQPGANGQPRARVYQLGPFRIGFGAVRGDLFHNLHQQIHQGNPGQPAANPIPNPAGRQIGLGFGFGRRPQIPTPAPAPQAPGTQPSSAVDLNLQLLQIEQRINAEMNSLRVATEQLNRVRQLQVELEQLRNGNPFAPPGLSLNPGLIPPGYTSHRVDTSPGATMGAGDPRLPEGLTLPAGWTLVPLQSMQNGVPQTAQPAPTTEPIPDTTSSSAAAPQDATAFNFSQLELDGTQSSDTATETPATTNGNVNLQPTPIVSSSEPRADSPSQEWTDVAPTESTESPKEGPVTIPTTWGSNNPSATAHDSADPDDSESKGKARAATVEETDEDAS
jgi:E3 ubiquitin-protein ligase synoviolin